MEKDGEKGGEKDREKGREKDVANEAESKERLWGRKQKLVEEDVGEDERLQGKVLKGQKLVVPDVEGGEDGVRREEIGWMQMVPHSTKLIRSNGWRYEFFFTLFTHIAYNCLVHVACATGKKLKSKFVH